MSEHQAKIIIIGGGGMGLACAWRLAAAGPRVTVLESRQCGAGATLASLGALWPASPLVDGPLQRLHRSSLWAFEPFTSELAAASGIAVAYRRLGRVEYLDSEKNAARAREEAAACADWPSPEGLPPREVLDPPSFARTYRGLAPAEFGGVVCRATAQVRVADLIAALRAACLRRGVEIREQSPAAGVQLAGARAIGVCVGNDWLPADAVLLTAGAWAEKLWPAATVRPVKGQGVALRLPPGLRLPGIIKSGPIYLVPWEQHGEVLVGSTTEPDAGFDETPTAPARAELLAGAARIVPALAGAELLRHWAGLRPQNPAKRHPPIMGRDAHTENLYLCAGHFKTGIGMAPRVAQLMTELIMNGSCPELLPFAPRA